jgi:hypothetical protein
MLRFGIAFFDGSAQSQSELDQKLLVVLLVILSRYLLVLPLQRQLSSAHSMAWRCNFRLLPWFAIENAARAAKTRKRPAQLR